MFQKLLMVQKILNSRVQIKCYIQFVGFFYIIIHVFILTQKVTIAKITASIDIHDYVWKWRYLCTW
jgi:hypothetical protein